MTKSIVSSNFSRVMEQQTIKINGHSAKCHNSSVNFFKSM